MLASTALYSGIVAVLIGTALWMKPVRRLRVTRRRALVVVTAGIVAIGVALAYPVFDSRTSRATSRLDEFVPVWQFREFHSIRIASPPARVFEVIKRVRADEIFLFRTLIWIRNGLRPPPQAIRDAARSASLIDVATRSSFVYLADDAPREFVVATLVGWQGGARPAITPAMFQKPLPPGTSIAAMNFIVAPDGAGGSIVSTETRVFANSASARRRFATYWRVIYPGSAIIRRMWLRAIQHRATSPETT